MRTIYDSIKNKKEVFKKIESLEDFRENLIARLSLANKIEKEVKHSWVIAKEIEVILHMLDTLPEMKKVNVRKNHDY